VDKAVVLHCIQLIADVKEIVGKDVLSKLTKFFSRERLINILAAVTHYGCGWRRDKHGSG